MRDAIRSIVIVGGGTAGWMSATCLARHLVRLKIAITVVEGSDFVAAAGLGEPEVPRGTEGTIRYGIRFRGWKEAGHDFFHPFALHGMSARGAAFHCWRKRRAAGERTPLAACSLATRLAAGLFLPPNERPASIALIPSGRQRLPPLYADARGDRRHPAPRRAARMLSGACPRRRMTAHSCGQRPVFRKTIDLFGRSPKL